MKIPRRVVRPLSVALLVLSVACNKGGGSPAAPSGNGACLDGGWTSQVEDLVSISGAPLPLALGVARWQVEQVGPVLADGSVAYAIASEDVDVPELGLSLIRTPAGPVASLSFGGYYYDAVADVSVEVAGAGITPACDRMTIAVEARCYAGNVLVERQDPETHDFYWSIAEGAETVALQRARFVLQR